ncbi:MAG TPA: OmpA family protein [Burkholderiaceae bacterium]|nr:OmpA family protein [Burkholderiaceae bacterium]
MNPRIVMWLLSALVPATQLLSGCGTPVASSSKNELPFEQAVTVATDGLIKQTQTLPGFLAKMEAKVSKKGLLVDPMIDASSGQQTGITKQLEQLVTTRLRDNYPQVEILPFQAANLPKAQYLLTGTTSRVQSDKASHTFDINLAITDLKTGKVVAQSSARSLDQGLDATPTAYYRDSPILVKDKVVEGYVRTTATPPGGAADPTYLERINTAPVVNDATNAYNAEHYQESLTLYNSVAGTPAGEQIRVLNGIYLSNWKLGKTAEAEEAFGKIVALGLANRSLGVKFLFNPGTTEFWSDPKVSGPYTFWLRQIARQTAASKACMSVVGHTSRTGSEATNDRLSLQRANYIKDRMEKEAATLMGRLKPSGVGFRENIVGTGTDDVRDALDRRVEFKITDC